MAIHRDPFGFPLRHPQAEEVSRLAGILLQDFLDGKSVDELKAKSVAIAGELVGAVWDELEELLLMI